MKKIIFSSIIAIAFLTSCGSSTSKDNKDSVATPAPTSETNPANGAQISAVKYQCPMKCEGDKTYDTAGKCPMCQMDMKEVK